jgi:hypothetical protein
VIGVNTFFMGFFFFFVRFFDLNFFSLGMKGGLDEQRLILFVFVGQFHKGGIKKQI